MDPSSKICQLKKEPLINLPDLDEIDLPEALEYSSFSVRFNPYLNVEYVYDSVKIRDESVQELINVDEEFKKNILKM